MFTKIELNRIVKRGLTRFGLFMYPVIIVGLLSRGYPVTIPVAIFVAMECAIAGIVFEVLLHLVLRFGK